MKEHIDWKIATGQLLQSAMMRSEGGFALDENGHLIDNYLEEDEEDEWNRMLSNDSTVLPEDPVL